MGLLNRMGTVVKSKMNKLVDKMEIQGKPWITLTRSNLNCCRMLNGV